MTDWPRNAHTVHQLELPDYLKGVSVRIPYHVVRGAEDGPTLYVQACQHGTEINGWEAVRQVLAAVTPERLRGTLIAVPVANPIAFQARMHGYPSMGHNMNRVWPGDANGPFLPHRMAALLWDALITRADAAVDLHCWADFSIPAAWTAPGFEPWICAFGTPFIFELAYDASTRMLQNACHEAGTPCCVLEMIPQDAINPDSAPLGRRGTMNLLRYMGMLDGPMEYPAERYLFTPGPVDALPTASVDGMWVTAARKGTLVREGDVLGHVYAWDTHAVLETITAPMDGLYYLDRPCVAHGNHNLVEPGTEVACVRAVKRVLRPEDGP
ncbi:MAG TPA: succinylglutamate desuccinylase/aspartoacylase family protein [Armatimonadota bacterium]|nr:succinylglutamate desuccinylase/aspartoacylase family protein [Armatimonadota bacterium]